MFIGIVGKPNIGKSTFFKAATLAEVEIANYPFATIKPNHAVAHVRVKSAAVEFGKTPNPRVGYFKEGIRFVPIDIMDVAGLVPGAHKGLGMGNQFLDDLRQADALIHIIDVSGSVNEKGEPVEALSYDPAKDIVFLEEELDFWYLDILKRGWDKFSRQVQQEKSVVPRAIAKQLSALKVTEKLVEDLIKQLGLAPDKPTSWSEEDLLGLAKGFRKKTKPILIVANKIDIPGADKNFEKLKQEFPDYIIIPCSAESELALREASNNNLIDYTPGDEDFKVLDESKLTEKQVKALEFIKSIIKQFGSTGVQQALDDSVFTLLKYKAIFPGGVNKLEDSEGRVLPDCFLMSEKATALDFAFQLHTDFGKNFIKAIDVRSKLPVAKDHILKHRDVVEIMAGK